MAGQHQLMPHCSSADFLPPPQIVDIRTGRNVPGADGVGPRGGGPLQTDRSGDALELDRHIDPETGEALPGCIGPQCDGLRVRPPPRRPRARQLCILRHCRVLGGFACCGPIVGKSPRRARRAACQCVLVLNWGPAGSHRPSSHRARAAEVRGITKSLGLQVVDPTAGQA